MRRLVAPALLIWSASLFAAAPLTLPPGPPLNATQIVDKNVAARGGLAAWRRVETMAWAGHVEDPRSAAPPMPFAMELGRPNKTHFEISARDRKFARIFDGSRGWRVRPGSNGAPETKPFSNEEADFSRDEFVIEGPLIDYKAKGVAIELAGLDEIEGRKAYLLNVKLPSGAARRVWIDAETFLDLRTDRPSTSPMFKGAPVSVYYRDYRSIEGLQIPLTIESRTGTTSPPQRLVIDKVVLNPKLSTQAFAKPPTVLQRHAIVRVGGDSPSMLGGPAPARP